ncbi:hypothetical protein PBI_INGRID_81 [Arthrobacter phage Ingrid]|nr:hypothetical protein PBI_INGRID_81 [Arthrobacter phage Ingrid]QFG11057.1 hypothetical protein PBI_LORETTA_77 [Arthrobacter phage Loretta]
MSQTLYMPGEAATMMVTMCERVNLSKRAGSYILAMCRLNSRLPGGLIDMVEVAQLIKYVSEHQEDLKPQYRMGGSATRMSEPEKPANFTFLK